jgi:hypothetical protein
MAESEAPSVPVPAAVGLHEEIWDARSKFRRVVSWARAVAAWLASLVALGAFLLALNLLQNRVLSFQLPSFLPILALVIYIVAGVVIFGVTGIFVLRDARTARQVLAGWEQGLLPFFYSVKFELLPVSGSDREADIARRYRSLLPTIPRVNLRQPLRWGIRTRAEVRGKTKEHFFHVFGYVPRDLLLLGRRYPSDRPVGPDELRALKSDAEDVLERWRAERVVVTAFSPQDFAPGSVELVRSGEGLVRGMFSIALIQETAKGYRVVSA